jgi:hypothetical protein
MATQVTLMTTSRDLACRAFNIFQFYQYCLYFTIYRWYFLLKFEQFHEYLIQHSFKSGGTKDHLRQVKESGTAPYLQAWVIFENMS